MKLTLAMLTVFPERIKGARSCLAAFLTWAREREHAARGRLPLSRSGEQSTVVPLRIGSIMACRHNTSNFVFFPLKLARVCATSLSTWLQ